MAKSIYLTNTTAFISTRNRSMGKRVRMGETGT
jgi:hypothetical protein